MKPIVWTTFLCFWCIQVSAQVPGELPVENILNQLETQYDVSFSYLEENVTSKTLNYSINSSDSLDQHLNALERLLKIRFERVNNNYVLIRPFVDNDLISICGQVIDEEGNPIPDLLIQTEEESLGAVTDRKGYFEATVSYNQLITLSHVGFVTKRSEANRYFTLECTDVSMLPTVSFLEELVVSEYLTVGITKEGNSIGIFPQELKNLPGLVEPDPLQSIQQVPGILSPYETASGIHVRGGAPDQNLVLWNGIKTYHQAHFFGMLSAFNPYITEEVKFIKHGTSARYGDRVSGVIDIRTSEEVARKFTGGAGFNMINADAHVNAPIIENKLSVLVSARRSYTDLLKTFTYNQYAERVFQNTKINEGISIDDDNTENTFYFSDFNSSIILQPTASDKFIINTLYNKNDLDFSTSDNTQSRSLNDHLRTANEGYGLKWRHQSNSTTFSTNINYAKYLLRYQFSDSKQDTISTSSKKNLVSDWGFRSQMDHRFSEDHQLILGHEYSQNNTRYAFEDTGPNYYFVLDQDDRTLQTHSGYAEYQFENEPNSLTVGTRFNYYVDLKKWYLEPRLVYSRQLWEPVRFSISGEYRTQPISQIKESVVSDLSLENQVWKLATIDRFPVIESHQVSSGLSFERNHWFLDAEAYYKEIDGVTSLTFGFLNPVDNEYRTGMSKIHGADVLVKKQISNYKTWVGYTYIYTENQFEGLNNDLPFPGNWNIEHQVRWSHFVTLDKLQFSLGWMWHTGKAFTKVTTTTTGPGPVEVQYSGINNQNLPVYHRLDFSAVYDLTMKKTKNIRYRIGLSVLNVYDRRNLLNREFRTTPSLENELLDTRIYSLGITPNLVFRVFW